MTPDTEEGSVEAQDGTAGGRLVLFLGVMDQPIYRSFTAADGREWRVSEFFATKLIRQLNIDSGDEVGHVPLLLTSGSEWRWVSHGPSDWPDVSEAELAELLLDSTPMPESALDLGGYPEA